MRLQSWRDVGQQCKISLAIRLGQVRLKIFEDVERDRARLARVQVPRIFARPAKSFSLDPLHARAVDLSRFPKIKLGLRKIAPDDTDEFHRRKITRGRGSVRGRAA